MLIDTDISRHWWRRFYVGWALFLVFLWLVQATNGLMEDWRDGEAIPLWRPFLTEFTGVLPILVLIPLIAWFDRLYPFRRDVCPRALLAHALATLPVAVIHVSLMVGLRKLVFPLFGAQYEFGPLLFEFVYEYRKITLGYILIVLSLYGFRHYVMLRRLIDMPEADAGQENERGPTARFLARRHNRELVVSADDIRRIEAAGNYVVLHTPQGELKLRETMDGMEKRLDPERFVRVHRSHIVNLDAVQEIQPWFHGDQRVVLRDGSVLNLSRRYRDRLRRLTAA